LSGSDAASSCLACNGPLALPPAIAGVDRLHAVNGSFEVAICRVCGSGLTLPEASADELAPFYPQEYGAYGQPLHGLARFVSTFVRRFHTWRTFRIEPLRLIPSLTPGRALDVGCGAGYLGERLIGRGWQVAGVEPDGSACVRAREVGVDARQGTLAHVELEADAYDLVIFRHSLEHTPDPVGDLGRVARALHPGGTLLISVPNFASRWRRVFGSRWFPLDLPRHRTHFTPKGMRRALEQAGLQVTDISHASISVSLPASIQYALAGRCLFPGGVSLRIAAGVAGLLLPLTALIDRILQTGDELNAVAVRPREH
jgi:SAM-dependent methyltransferase